MKVDLNELTALWNDGTIRNDELARRLGVTAAQLHLIRHRFGLPCRYYRDDPKDDITVSEIRRRAAEIRKGWSEEERHRREVGRGHVRWSLPSFDYDHRNAAFTPT